MAQSVVRWKRDFGDFREPGKRCAIFAILGRPAKSRSWEPGKYFASEEERRETPPVKRDA